MTLELDIVSIGMVTAVGLDAPSACAAMRARLDGFQETRFLGPGGDWLVGAPVPLPRNFIGEKRLAHMAAAAILEAIDDFPDARSSAALILCLAEEDRPGRLAPDASRLAARIAEITGLASPHRTRIVAHGRPSGIVALDQARRLLADGTARYVMICGVDSYLTTLTIAHYLAERRLLTPDNPNGFIPGEAAAAILCTRPGGGLRLRGLGLAREPAYIYNPAELPLKGEGITAAYRAALDEAGLELNGIGYRIADLTGEQHFFKQSALASIRLLRGRHDFQDLWSPAELLGNVGAAVVPLMIGMAATAAIRGYSGGDPPLVEAASDFGACACAIFGKGAVTVFANGLEVACKAQANKVIAAFPYVCMTPPQTPATPPGVPVPYPTFGMDGDTDKGTSTVKIGGKTVTQKNLSHYKKCTGNEAGCAPMKNVVSHVNTGKEYAHAWSGNVRMDGEPVSRFSDISSNDHASPMAGGPPYPKVGILDVSDPRCAFLGIKPYDQLKCDPGEEKEHTVEVQFFTAGGVRDLTLKCCELYDDTKAPCICMKAEWLAGEAATARKAGATGKVVGRKRKTPHNKKSADARNWLKSNPNGKLGGFADTCVASTVKNMNVPPSKRAIATECLEVANMNYMKSSMGKTEKQVKDKKRCQDKCSRAQDQTRLVRVAKKRLKKAAPAGATVVARASDVAQSKVACDYTP